MHARAAETMAENSGSGSGRNGSRWRAAGWSAVGLILLLPLIAMRFTDEVQWEAGDFFVAAVLLFGVGLGCELAARKTSSSSYRSAVAVALVAALLLCWVNGAVGIIGSEDNPANLMYGGVLLVGAIGAAIARLRPLGMARALLATALAQASVAAVALITGMGEPASGSLAVVALNGFFVALFVASALLFRKAARD